MLLMLLPAVSFCVLASSIGSKLRGQTGEWPVDVVALAAPIRVMDHILGFQERHSRREGSARAAVAQTRTVSNASIAPAPMRLIDSIKSPGARPFVLRAEELARKNDFKQAKLQLTMALHMERGNPRLEAFAKELDDGAKKQAEGEKNNWKK